jgi:hypothetical protein
VLVGIVRPVPWVSDEEWARISAQQAPEAPALRLPTNTNRSHPEGAENPVVEPIPAEDGVHVPDCVSPPPFAFVSLSTGSVVPARCGRLSCPGCCLLNARTRSLAISFARPERAVLLTDVGNEFAQIRARVNRLRYDITKQLGAKFEMVYSIEPNPSGDGRHHLHGWQHGDFVPQAALSKMAARRGMGEFARISRVRSTVGAGRYGLKGLGYGLKGTQQVGDAQREYLALNGKRLTHQTRGFFRDAEGASIPTREAEAQARAAAGQKDVGPWQLIAL